MREAERGAEWSWSGSWEKVWRGGRGGGRRARGPPRRAQWLCSLPETKRVRAGAQRPPGQARTRQTPRSREAHPAAPRAVQRCESFSCGLRILLDAPTNPSWRRGPYFGEAFEDGGWPSGPQGSDLSLENSGANVHTIIQQTLSIGDPLCAQPSAEKCGEGVKQLG